MQTTRALTSRSNRTATAIALLCAVLALSMPVSAASPFSRSESSSKLPSIEIVLSNGSTWRGDIGIPVRISFAEHSVAQTLVGTLSKVESTHVVLATTLVGRPVDKPIYRLDITAMETIGGEAVDETKPASAAPRVPRAEGAPATSKATPAGLLTVPAGGEPRKVPKPGVFVLPLSGTVGYAFRHQEIEAIAAEADKHGPGQIIVLLIDSGGGLVMEADRISDSLQAIKKRHRVVAWIKEAISGAAFTAIHCDEIYFMRVGALGAITMFAGETAISGAELEDWLRRCSEVAKLGGRNPIPVRAMVTISQMASYDKDPVTGRVAWHPSTEGMHVLSSEKENLVLNASNALHSGFSDGTADTPKELAALLQLPEWHEISDYGRRIAKRWQETVAECEREVPNIIARLDFKNLNNGAEAALRTRMQLLRELQHWWDRCDNVMRYRFRAPGKDDLERFIRDLQKQLADTRRGRGP